MKPFLLRALNARLPSNLLADTSGIQAEVTSQIAEGDFATATELTDGLAAKADSGDLSDLTDTVNTKASITQLATGAGLPMALAIATYTGSGTSDQVSSPFSLPSGITAQDEHQYEISGSFNVTDASNAQVASVSYRGLRIEYEATGTTWTVVKTGDVTYKTETGWDSLFQNASRLPGFDFNDGDVNFGMTVRPLDAAVVKVTGDFVIADLGQNHS